MEEDSREGEDLGDSSRFSDNFSSSSMYKSVQQYLQEPERYMYEEIPETEDTFTFTSREPKTAENSIRTLIEPVSKKACCEPKDKCTIF